MSQPLTQRERNRALLARQHLLERKDAGAIAMIQHLVGMQAQVPQQPYVALWSRLHDFAPEQLEGLVLDRSVLRMPLMRTTLHLVTAADAAALWPLMAPVLARVFRSSTPWGRQLGGLDTEKVVEAGRRLLEDEPRTNRQLATELGRQWPEVDPQALAMAVHHLTPIVQIPPRGLWSRSGRPTWTTVEHYLGRPVPATIERGPVLLRYLAAFGPATAADVTAWSGWTGVRETLEELRASLITLKDEAGREIFDLPDAPRPSHDTPAPPRFLPEYDNALLSHRDRTHVIPEAVGMRLTGYVGTFMVDGFLCGQWRIVTDKSVATIEVDPFIPLTVADKAEVANEAEALLRWNSPSEQRYQIHFGPLTRTGRPWRSPKEAQ